ncbi:RDD family protein [Streptomyces carpaticus]|uniref:RDD family protein n=1 Tax=Streptomyces carpaticus TaxID=285558 RepID=UPI00220888D9|nr:RDD family protein [Streptomyces carpaticus]
MTQQDPAPPPARAPRTRRLLAWLLDFTVILAIAALLGWLTFNRISAKLTGVPGLVGISAWQLVTSGGDLVGAGQGVGSSLWRSSVRAVWQGFAGLVVFAFAYRFASLALMGRTPGQALLALRVTGRRDGARPARATMATRAAAGTLVDVGWYALACCLLVGGAIGLSVLCWILAVAVFGLSALLALAGPRRSLADRAAGTTVVSVFRITTVWTRLSATVRRRTPDEEQPPLAPVA